jgi:hypothetical protein
MLASLAGLSFKLMDGWSGAVLLVIRRVPLLSGKRNGVR